MLYFIFGHANILRFSERAKAFSLFLTLFVLLFQGKALPLRLR
jgi:hypothetical protein